MSKSRLFSVFVIVALVAVAVLLVHEGIVTSEVTARSARLPSKPDLNSAEASGMRTVAQPLRNWLSRRA